jgi:glucokinase
MSQAIVMDVGGTNARIAISSHKGFSHPKHYECSKYPGGLKDIIQEYIDEMIASGNLRGRPERGVFAVAGPVNDPSQFRFGSIPQWGVVDFKKMGEELNIEISLINDFEANGYAMLSLEPTDCIDLHGGRDPFYPRYYFQGVMSNPDANDRLIMPRPRSEHRNLIIGPGTGLGAATTMVVGTQFLVVDGEGGHGNFYTRTSREAIIVEEIQRQSKIAAQDNPLSKVFEDVSYETVCCGPGLVRLFNAIHSISQSNVPLLTSPEQVVEAAKTGECQVSVEALDFFTRALGRAASSGALFNNVRGGVVIAGGIVQKIGHHFNASVMADEFVSNDLDKSNFLLDVPIVRITNENAGLAGAHNYVRHYLG